MHVPGWWTGFVVLAVVWAGLPPHLLAFSILVPEDLSVVEPGRTISVQVDPGGEIGLERVRYFWYHGDQEPASSHQAQPALIASPSSSPPFGGRLRVPLAAIGTMRLLAVAEVSGGRLAGRSREEFDEVLLRAEPSAELLRIWFASEEPWQPRTIGRIYDLPVFGDFADGAVRSLGGSSTGSTFFSSNNKVVETYQAGLVRVTGSGEATVIVRNRGRNGRLKVKVRGNDQPNQWPTAEAGPTLNVKSGQTVMLNAIRSMDPDGDPLRYEWTQVRGHKVPLLDAGTSMASFVAPKVSGKRLLRFRLRVTDMEGADTLKGADSLPSFLNVWVEP